MRGVPFLIVEQHQGVYEQNSIEKIARFCKTETTKDALMGCVKDKSSGLECLFNFQAHEAEEL